MPIELSDDEIGLGEENEKDPRWAERAESVFDQLARKNWKELEALEHAGYLLFPEVLLRRQKDGTFEKKPVALRVPRMHEIRQAHVMARRLATEDGLDPKQSPTLFEELENIVILWMAVRSPNPPHEPFAMDPRELEKLYDGTSLAHLYGKLESYRKVIDPAPELLTREAFLALVAAVAEGRNIAPLAVIGGRAQVSFIVTMATLLANSLRPSSSSLQSEISTPGFSPSESSTLSSQGAPTKKEGRSSTNSGGS